MLKIIALLDSEKMRWELRWEREKSRNFRKKLTNLRWIISVFIIFILIFLLKHQQASVLSEKTKLKQMDDDMEGILSSINSI